MASLFIELQLGSQAAVAERLRMLNVHFVRAYPHISTFLGTQVLLFDAPVGLPIPQLTAIPGIQYAEPDEEHIYVDINMRGSTLTSYPSSLPVIMDQIGATRAQARSSGGAGSVILIVDSGIDGRRVAPDRRAGGWTDHPSGDPWQDDFGHGTMVALTALAVAPNARVFSVRIKPGPGGGIMKESVMSAIDSLIPMITPSMQLAMNNSWGTSGCGEDDYW